MSSASLVRLGGLAALTGGVLVAITALLELVALDYENFYATAQTGAYAFISLLYLLAVALVLVGLVGLYAGQAEAQDPVVAAIRDLGRILVDAVKLVGARLSADDVAAAHAADGIVAGLGADVVGLAGAIDGVGPVGADDDRRQRHPAGHRRLQGRGVGPRHRQRSGRQHQLGAARGYCCARLPLPRRSQPPPCSNNSESKREEGKVAEKHLRIAERHRAQQVVRVAEDVGAGLIVMGSRGPGEIRRALIGSVSDSVIRHAHCPVLVARPEQERAA
jgi:Universal stress protein family